MIVAHFRQTRPTSDKKICFSFHTSHGQRNMQTPRLATARLLKASRKHAKLQLLND